MLPTEGSRRQRKQEKYIFLSLIAPSKALHSSSFTVSCSPVFSFSLTATSHFALILLVFAPHSFLNPKSLFPSQLALFNCSPHTSLLPTSSLFSCLSITSEHATSQHKPSYTARITVAHLIFLSFISPSSFVFLCCILSPLGNACLLVSSFSSVFKNIFEVPKELQIIPKKEIKKAIICEF